MTDASQRSSQVSELGATDALMLESFVRSVVHTDRSYRVAVGDFGGGRPSRDALSAGIRRFRLSRSSRQFVFVTHYGYSCARKPVVETLALSTEASRDDTGLEFSFVISVNPEFLLTRVDSAYQLGKLRANSMAQLNPVCVASAP